jgi:hypothetical protein
MRLRIRVWLPLLQLTIAVVLTTVNLLRHNSIENPSWVKPEKQICDGINAPATLVRFLLTKIGALEFPTFTRLTFVLEIMVYFVLVGLLWYVVALQVDRKTSSNESHALAPSTPIRAILDVLLILFALALMVFGALVRHQFGGRPDIYSTLISISAHLYLSEPCRTPRRDSCSSSPTRGSATECAAPSMSHALRPSSVDLAGPILVELALFPADRSTRHRPPLAAPSLPLVLGTEIGACSRKTRGGSGDSRFDSAHEPS